MKNLEIEIAYLRKELNLLMSFIDTMEVDNHLHITNVYYSKDFLNKLDKNKE